MIQWDRKGGAPVDGFSHDGYITDQHCFSGYRYRRMPSSVNGCGWIAAYNLLHFLGTGVDFDAVRRGMDALIRPQIPGPTPMRTMRKYLRRVGAEYTAGKRKALAAAKTARAGILRYWEGREPHFIAFLRLPDGRFRFLNVSGGRGDFALPMDEFFQKHCRFGYIRVMTVK